MPTLTYTHLMILIWKTWTTSITDAHTQNLIILSLNYDIIPKMRSQGGLKGGLKGGAQEMVVGEEMTTEQELVGTIATIAVTPTIKITTIVETKYPAAVEMTCPEVAKEKTLLMIMLRMRSPTI